MGKGSKFVYIKPEFEGEVTARHARVNQAPSLKVYRNGVHDPSGSFNRNWRQQAEGWLSYNGLTLAVPDQLGAFWGLLTNGMGTNPLLETLMVKDGVVRVVTTMTAHEWQSLGWSYLTV